MCRRMRACWRCPGYRGETCWVEGSRGRGAKGTQGTEGQRDEGNRLDWGLRIAECGFEEKAKRSLAAVSRWKKDPEFAGPCGSVRVRWRVREPARGELVVSCEPCAGAETR